MQAYRSYDARARVGAPALLVLGLLALIACAPAASDAPATGSPSASAGVAIPTGQLPPLIQCLVDRGFRVTGVEPPQAEWARRHIAWSRICRPTRRTR